jgi:hypothetical protein
MEIKSNKQEANAASLVRFMSYDGFERLFSKYQIAHDYVITLKVVFNQLHSA